MRKENLTIKLETSPGCEFADACKHFYECKILDKIINLGRVMVKPDEDAEEKMREIVQADTQSLPPCTDKRNPRNGQPVDVYVRKSAFTFKRVWP